MRRKGIRGHAHRRPSRWVVALLSTTCWTAACDLFGGDETGGETGSTSSAEATPPSSSATPDTATEVARRPVAATGNSERFTLWRPVHAFLDAAVTRGTAAGPGEAIVASRDNHVGVTRDSGQSWTWKRHTNGWVMDVGGFSGGPFVIVGAAGYAAISSDGGTWKDLPRQTEHDLIGVSTSDLGIIAVTSKGGFVRYAKDGSGGQFGWLPGGFKAKGVTVVNATVVAHAGKKAYGTADGVTWTAFASSPVASTTRFGTSAGSCALGKVGKRKGVVCAVKGVAHGIAEGVVAVEDKGTISLTTDGGNSWRVGTLPFKGANAIFGGPAGPFYALGNSGAVAVSRDGDVWTDLAWEDSASFRAGIVDGTNVVIVGDDSTIIYSNNSGNGWEYAEAPVAGNFKTIIKSDNEYVVGDGRTTITSPDGSSWAEDPGRETGGIIDGGSCDELPAPGTRCKYTDAITSPDHFPDVRGLDFEGDAGVAFGDHGLVAFSNDGGASWNDRQSLGLGPIRLLESEAQVVAASDGKRVGVSTDGGASFALLDVPGDGISTMMVTVDGSLWVAGRKSALMRSSPAGSAWVPATLPEGTKVDFVGLFEGAGAVFAAGKKGELLRTTDGVNFTTSITGRKEPIQAMTAEGTLVMAVTSPGRKTGNALLRSDDGGAHFHTAHEISDWSETRRFELAEGVLGYQDRVSKDYGATWHDDADWAWAAAEEVDDGSGARLFVRSLPYAKDRFFVMASKDDETWMIVDAPYTEGGWFRCTSATGCWMVAGGTVYRPG